MIERGCLKVKLQPSEQKEWGRGTVSANKDREQATSTTMMTSDDDLMGPCTKERQGTEQQRWMMGVGAKGKEGTEVKGKGREGVEIDDV